MPTALPSNPDREERPLDDSRVPIQTIVAYTLPAMGAGFVSLLITFYLFGYWRGAKAERQKWLPPRR